MGGQEKNEAIVQGGARNYRVNFKETQIKTIVKSLRTPVKVFISEENKTEQ